MNAKHLALIGGLLVLMAITIGYLLWDDAAPKPTRPASPSAHPSPPPPAPPYIAPQATAPEAPANKPNTPSHTKPTGAAETAPGDYARSRILAIRNGSEKLNAPKLYQESRELGEQQRLDDQHLLLYFLAKEDFSPAAFDLASHYDPLHYNEQAALTDRPQPNQALKWYQAAARSGDESARQRYQTLRQWLQGQAEQGDEQAAELLLSWP